MPLAMTGPQVCWKRTRNSSARAPVSSWACAQVAPEDERDHHLEGLVVARRQQPPGAVGGPVDDGGLLGVDTAARHDVGTVTVHRDEQRLERPAHRTVVDVDQDPPGQAHQPVDLGRLHVVDDEPLGLGDHVVERHPVGRGIRPEPVERVGPAPVDVSTCCTRSSAS